MFKNTKNKTFESWIAVSYLNAFPLLIQLVYFLCSEFLSFANDWALQLEILMYTWSLAFTNS